MKFERESEQIILYLSKSKKQILNLLNHYQNLRSLINHPSLNDLSGGAALDCYSIQFEGKEEKEEQFLMR